MNDLFHPAWQEIGCVSGETGISILSCTSSLHYGKPLKDSGDEHE